LAINHNLRVKANWGWVVILEENVESVSERGCGTVGPARSTVLRNMLVQTP
jgi:hypothetical protein